ncbi:unnamed protein product [Oikopleura dioica]|uniref:Uncharacterized protein n=1 Tax=Oikopleura dioica TaxID=34765 RepID=E4XEK8_OIKDI|nr:unnamed protein product [Oikopleura dioica]
MPQPLLWKASWIKFTFTPRQEKRVIQTFLTDFGPFDFKETNGGMRVKFTDPFVEEDFVKHGARKARMNIADGISLKIQLQKKDRGELALKQLRTQIAHETATAISQHPDTLDAMGEFFRESDFTKDEDFCPRREDDGDALESVIEALVKLPPFEFTSPKDIEIPYLPCPDHELEKKLKLEAAKASPEDKIFAETLITKMYDEYLQEKNMEKMFNKNSIFYDITENNNDGFSTEPSWSKTKTMKITAAQL